MVILLEKISQAVQFTQCMYKLKISYIICAINALIEFAKEGRSWFIAPH